MDATSELSKPTNSSTRRISTCIALNLGPFLVGLCKGYASPALSSMLRGEAGSPVQSHFEASNLIASSLLGALIGCFLASLVSILFKMGHRQVLILVSLTMGLTWLIISLVVLEVSALSVAWFVAGVCAAILQIGCQAYVATVAPEFVRSRFCCLLKTASQLGFLLNFILGGLLHWRLLASVCALSSIMFVLVLTCIDDFVVHNVDDDDFESKESSRNATRSIGLQSKKLSRPLIITFGLTLFNRLSGVSVLTFYTQPLLEQKLCVWPNPYVASVLTAFTPLVASMLTCILINHVSNILILCCSIMSSAMLILTLIQNFQHPILIHLRLICILSFLLANYAGPNPMSYIMIVELFKDRQRRHVVLALNTCFGHVASIIGLHVFIYVNQKFHFALLLSAIPNVSCLVFCTLCVPRATLKDLKGTENCSEAEQADLASIKPS